MSTTDERREELATTVTHRLVNVVNLPEWMQVPALGRNLRPLGDLAADAIAPLVERWLSEERERVLREAAEEIERVDRIGMTRADEIAADEREWFQEHPLRNVDGYQRRRPIIARWLRDRAEADQ